MPDLNDRLGICSWSVQPKNPQDLIQKLRDTNLSAVQLGLNVLRDNPDTWANAVDELQKAGVTILSGMFGTVGEDYSTLESIARTGGILPDEHWDENQAIVEDVAQLARQHNLQSVSFHAGFIPHDSNDPTYQKVLQRVQWIADRFAQDDIDVLFETGQETAEDLIAFLNALNRPNVGVNFDPANMILYGKGDPIDAMRRLMPQIKQVHIKDATSSDQPGVTWGAEVPVGDGEVDWRAFLRTLHEAHFAGPLAIEREAGDQRVADIRRGADHLRALAP